MKNPLLAFAASIRADFSSLQRYREKYHAEKVSVARLPLEVVRKIGFQMLIATRVMRLSRDIGLPLVPQITSRLIRHWYGAEIHWHAEIADGVSIVHGNGLVISHRAKVGPGSILFQNVTLGEGLDAESRQSGAPSLGRDVHVGPGATLLGPIHIGDGTKIMAGSVVTKSVPANSLVKPAEVEVTRRSPPAKVKVKVVRTE